MRFGSLSKEKIEVSIEILKVAICRMNSTAPVAIYLLTLFELDHSNKKAEKTTRIHLKGFHGEVL